MIDVSRGKVRDEKCGSSWAECRRTEYISPGHQKADNAHQVWRTGSDRGSCAPTHHIAVLDLDSEPRERVRAAVAAARITVGPVWPTQRVRWKTMREGRGSDCDIEKGLRTSLKVASVHAHQVRVFMES